VTQSPLVDSSALPAAQESRTWGPPGSGQRPVCSSLGRAEMKKFSRRDHQWRAFCLSEPPVAVSKSAIWLESSVI